MASEHGVHFQLSHVVVWEHRGNGVAGRRGDWCGRQHQHQFDDHAAPEQMMYAVFFGFRRTGSSGELGPDATCRR